MLTMNFETNPNTVFGFQLLKVFQKVELGFYE